MCNVINLDVVVLGGLYGTIHIHMVGGSCGDSCDICMGGVSADVSSLCF